MDGIENHVIEEGNLIAVKDTSDFGGPNKWHLRIKDVNGNAKYVQWMDISNIQPFFKTPLPRYEETTPRNYKKV